MTVLRKRIESLKRLIIVFWYLRLNDVDTDMLVPLTASLYVPGKLADIQKVVVDIGTGYFAEKVVFPLCSCFGEIEARIDQSLNGTEHNGRERSVHTQSHLLEGQLRQVTRDTDESAK